MSNKIVGEITNVVGFETDKRSYEQVKKDMQNLSTHWNRCADKMKTPALEKMKQVSRELKRQRDLVKEIQRIQAATKNPVTTPSRTPRTSPTRQPRQPRRPLGLPVGGKALKIKSIIGRAGEESRPALTMEQAAKGLAIARQRLALSEIQKRNAKREGDYQRMMITSASQLSRIQKADVALRYEAIRAMQKQLALEKAGKTTRNQTRMLQARYVRDLRRNARMRSNSKKAGRINTSPKMMGPGVGAAGMSGAAVGVAAVAAVGAAIVAAVSAGIQKGFDTISASTQRQGDRDLLQKGYGISDVEFRAVQKAVREGSGFNLSAEKYNDMNKDLREKAGESLQGTWKKDKKTGEWKLSGGGELGSDLLTAVANREGIKKAKAMQRALQDMTTVEFVQMLKNMEKSGKYTANEVRFFAEAINDVSLLLPGAENLIDRVNLSMEQIISSGMYLTEQEQESIRQLQGMGAAFDQASNTLGDKFTASVGATLEQYGIDQKAVNESMAKLRPLVEDLGTVMGWSIHRLKEFVDNLAEAYNKIREWFLGGREETMQERMKAESIEGSRDQNWYFKRMQEGASLSDIDKEAEYLRGGGSYWLANQMAQLHDTFAAGSLGYINDWNKGPLTSSNDFGGYAGNMGQSIGVDVSGKQAIEVSLNFNNEMFENKVEQIAWDVTNENNRRDLNMMGIGN